MSTGFDEFMRQYGMKGSEKADGYSRDAFLGLDEFEKKEVFKLLVMELPFSAEWLFFLDAEKALPVAKEEENRLRGNGFQHVYMLQEQIVKYTGDIRYQNRMIEDYSGYKEYIKPHVVDAVGHKPVNQRSLNFFKQVILTETNADAVARATRRLLAMHQIPDQG